MVYKGGDSIPSQVSDKYANKEVLVLSLRFLDTRERPAIIKEEFLDFANIERTTGDAISDKLIDILRLLEIPTEKMQGQAYDCVGNIYVYKVSPRYNKTFDSQTSEERYGHFYCK